MAQPIGRTFAVPVAMPGLLTQDKAGQWATILAAVGMNIASRQSYEEYFVSCNPWLPRRKVFAGDVETGEQVSATGNWQKPNFIKTF
jgi:hypothetical protein